MGERGSWAMGFNVDERCRRNLLRRPVFLVGDQKAIPG
jgi:hypothetical protein